MATQLLVFEEQINRADLAAGGAIAYAATASLDALTSRRFFRVNYRDAALVPVPSNNSQGPEVNNMFANAAVGDWGAAGDLPVGAGRSMIGFEVAEGPGGAMRLLVKIANDIAGAVVPIARVRFRQWEELAYTGDGNTVAESTPYLSVEEAHLAIDVRLDLQTYMALLASPPLFGPNGGLFGVVPGAAGSRALFDAKIVHWKGRSRLVTCEYTVPAVGGALVLP